MSVSPEYLAFLEELLEPLGRVRMRRIFGGSGMFRDDVMFGLVVDDVPYFRVDEATRPRFVQAGSEPFSYARANGRRIMVSYWRIPDALLEEPDELRDWAREAVAAAHRVAAARPKPKAKAAAKRTRHRAPA